MNTQSESLLDQAIAVILATPPERRILRLTQTAEALIPAIRRGELDITTVADCLTRAMKTAGSAEKPDRIAEAIRTGLIDVLPIPVWADTPPTEPQPAALEVQAVIEDTISGRRQAVPWPWPVISRYTRALLPGTVTMLCGDPGSGKSFLLLEAAHWWHRNGQHIALCEMEDGRAFHLGRALAQLEDNGSLVDPDWVKANPEESRAAYAHHEAFLTDFGRRIFAPEDEVVTLDDLLEWVRKSCAAGARIIAIDPVTAAATSDSPWVDDQKFLMGAKQIIHHHSASLILVTHPRKGRKNGTGLDDLAGGAAYQRFSQSVLWLERPAKPKEVRVASQFGDFSTSINRVLKMAKTRNGRGAGLDLAFNFDAKSFRFAEQGVIVKSDEEAAEAEVHV